VTFEEGGRIWVTVLKQTRDTSPQHEVQRGERVRRRRRGTVTIDRTRVRIQLRKVSYRGYMSQSFEWIGGTALGTEGSMFRKGQEKGVANAQELKF
jgi:hypothetical protein